MSLLIVIYILCLKSNELPFLHLKLSISPTILRTTEKARTRFKPVDRDCYFNDEIQLIHLPPQEDYRYQVI
jgi:hypothetical protein